MKTLNNKKMKTKYKLIPLSLLAFSINTAIAQDASQIEEIETITVQGYASSIKKALLSKRAASTVMDAIEAEDLGKFPDANVAESLQRITGVAIDRSGGEGNKISVRGLGPEYNVVTFNNRVLPNPDGSRSFSFDVLASEMISGAEVFKTSEARLSDGGIGAVVNVKSLKPLSLETGLTGAGSIKAMYDELADETTPNFSGLVNYKNDLGTFGVTASVAYHRRKGRADEASTGGGWVEKEFDLDANLAYELQTWAPKGVGYRLETTDRERLSGLIVTQWAPSDDLQITLDVLYSHYEIESDRNQVAHWWGTTNNNNAGPGSVKIDEQGTVVYWTGHAAPTEFVHSTGNRPTETVMFGANIEKYLADDSVIRLDMSHSKAENTAGGTQSFAVSGFRNTTESSSLFQLLPGEYVPSLLFPEFDEQTDSYTGNYISNPVALTDKSKLGNHFLVVEGDNNEDTISDIKLDWEKPVSWGNVINVKAGAFYNKRDFQRIRIRSADEVNNGTSTGFNDDIPDEIGVLIKPADFLPNVGGSFPTAWLKTDNEALREYYESDEFVKNGEFYNQRVDENGNEIPNLDYTPAVELANSPAVAEKKIGIYLQADLEGDVFNLPWSANLGVRAVKTEQKSSGYSETILSISPSPDDPTISIVEKSEAIPVTVNNEYTNVLPSFNFKIEPLDNIDVRFGVSQTITRPELGKIGVDAGINTRPGAFAINGGNPNLKPYKSTNLDVAVNWYVNESAYFGVAYMNKDIDDFIAMSTQQTIIAGEEFDETRPFNVEQASIEALEVGGHVMFDFLPGLLSGIGVQANYTFVDSDSSYRTGELTHFGIEGLSDTANFIASYEYGPLEFRASYNWRDKFLSNVSNGEGEPVYVVEYGQWDGSLNFDLTDELSIFAEGSNLTQEATRDYVRYENRIGAYTYNGRRFTLGIRGKF
ncbi:TonB-dependent receptor [Catenovulum sp. 2E275]|uniref:TonB-dependent receptor n=1 Tax=Catenovulum sp. 2E275 TaxID=2980497 RepID=UPI0021D0D750|nr:TonB-dependent receptor [Catenovulum sp. 2E275]MCU4677391.1 TonB-dependent receptor [Catenovulum sp. 2E275]